MENMKNSAKKKLQIASFISCDYRAKRNSRNKEDVKDYNKSINERLIKGGFKNLSEALEYYRDNK